jgi:protein-S-isoprenylcysteine O-methyltransferase Ste14
MWILARAVTYATFFIGFVLVYLPARLLLWAGIYAVPDIGPWQVAGFLLTSTGAVVALWCIFTLVFVGKGTPAPFDAPRKLVIRGPYQYVRNPMYIGATLTLLGAALVYESPWLVAYAAGFLLAMHLMVIIHEERALERTFGSSYFDYRKRTPRWLPKRREGNESRKGFTPPSTPMTD